MPKLLVVDDEPEITLLVARIFEKRGFQVMQCGDGVSALTIIEREGHPDIVLVDLNLPKLDGWEVCRRLKTAPATKHIPVVMMTAAHANVDDAQLGLAIGADEYVAKPFQREVLIHNIERLVYAKGKRERPGLREFMLYIRNDGSELAPAQEEPFLQACAGYIEELKRQGKLVSAQPLGDEGKILSKTDGNWNMDSYRSGREINAGYYHIRAEDLEEAIAIAKRNPEFTYRPTAKIEVRAIKTDEETTGYVYPSS
jgi:CheY-like chemotaxis protein